jgi:hypothetical protein
MRSGEKNEQTNDRRPLSGDQERMISGFDINEFSGGAIEKSGQILFRECQYYMMQAPSKRIFYTCPTWTPCLRRQRGKLSRHGVGQTSVHEAGVETSQAKAHPNLLGLVHPFGHSSTDRTRRRR